MEDRKFNVWMHEDVDEVRCMALNPASPAQSYRAFYHRVAAQKAAKDYFERLLDPLRVPCVYVAVSADTAFSGADRRMYRVVRVTYYREYRVSIS
jgi:hypothetical protein